MFKGMTTQAIRTEAIKNGMSTLYADGMLKVIRGITTFEEVYRVAKKTEQEALAFGHIVKDFGLPVGPRDSPSTGYRRLPCWTQSLAVRLVADAAIPPPPSRLGDLEFAKLFLLVKAFLGRCCVRPWVHATPPLTSGERFFLVFAAVRT